MPYYVEVRTGSRSGLLAGPIGARADAAELVPNARAAAIEVDPAVAGSVFGTVQLTPWFGCTLPEGRLNGALGLPVTAGPGGGFYAVREGAFVPVPNGEVAP